MRARLKLCIMWIITKTIVYLKWLAVQYLNLQQLGSRSSVTMEAMAAAAPAEVATTKASDRV